jgi:thymidine phosphorylase
MKTPEAARDLAQALVETANAAGCPTTALISDMNQPLVPSLGNALEVAEVMAVLTGQGKDPLVQVAAALGGALLVNGGLAKTPAAGAASIVQAIKSGKAAERFGKMLAAVGGPVRFLETWERFLPEANVLREVYAPQAGIVSAIDGTVLGNVVVDLGGGRRVETDVINPSVGLSRVARLGVKVSKGDPLAMIHAARPEDADRAARAVLAAIEVGEAAVSPPELIIEKVV